MRFELPDGEGEFFGRINAPTLGSRSDEIACALGTYEFALSAGSKKALEPGTVEIRGDGVLTGRYQNRSATRVIGWVILVASAALGVGVYAGGPAASAINSGDTGATIAVVSVAVGAVAAMITGGILVGLKDKATVEYTAGR